IAARGAGGADAGRAPGDRDDVLRRVDAWRSCGASQLAARHHQDAHSFGAAQTAASAGCTGRNAMTRVDEERCAQSEVTAAYAAQALPASDVAAAEAHIAACPHCRRE